MAPPPLPPAAGPDSLAGPSPALVRALRQALRPLVKLMLAQGITYPYLTDLLKGLFVDVAERDFRLDDKPPTDSRVSLVSGVHRKDVSRLRPMLRTPGVLAPTVVPLGAQLAARWMGDARYLQDDGQPRPLARLASEGGEQSFEALVASVNNDIRSRVVLDEWLRQGVVHLDEQGRVCLDAAAFVPTRGAEEKAFYLGHNLHDHAAATVHNVLGGEPPFLERSVHYNELSAASIARLQKLAEQQGMKALLAMNKAAMEAEATDRALDPQAPRQRFTLGVYFYSAPVSPGEESSE
ncbi:MAG: DUF6502 family protein [Hydrogenophaga sp.]|jgi:hypothetical protein|uniref:DUF6502 family protein n=1 Tax=Hydrogenophaga sp. TaxID=1904254 RepID=UPI001DE00590|nr:DUF6502 family protein [Hydrogenophaga sp.]MBW0169312.1 hypothetical protein [Hydrogenophaga sp.]MBW0183708.1 hypothetical protein [Hydrogenophaga sp.]